MNMLKITRPIDVSDEVVFQERVNGKIELLEKDGSEVVDVKYSAYKNGYTTHYTAVILYRSSNQR